MRKDSRSMDLERLPQSSAQKTEVGKELVSTTPQEKGLVFGLLDLCPARATASSLASLCR